MVLAVVNRAVVELMHPVLTAGAAGIIWVAANTRTRGAAIGIGIAAYVGAAVLHGLNDSVGGLLHGVNLLLALAFSYALIILLFLFWFRPQLARAADCPVRGAQQEH